MKQTISNGELTLCVDSMGAEITSLTRNGKDIIWWGDKTYWGEHCPTLFPCIGGNSEGVLRLEGKEYPLKKHGFAKEMEFRLDEATEDSLTYSIGQSEDTLKAFPYHFQFAITYKLTGNSLQVTWHVRNDSSGHMPFMVGAHPALVLPGFNAGDSIHGYLRFPEVDCLQSTHTQTHGLAEPSKVELFPLTDHTLPLTNETFADDTILDCTGRVSRVELLSKEHEPLVRIDFHMPVLALWAPQSGCCPFVCVEPWAGCCDEWQSQTPFDRRPYVNSAAPQEEWTLSYTISVLPASIYR